MKTTFPYTPADIAELNHQCDLLGLSPLDAEQVQLLTDPAASEDLAEERLAMVDDLAARVGVEIDPTDSNRHRLRDADALHDARTNAPALYDQLTRNVFALKHTGGEFYTWHKHIDANLYLAVADAQGNSNVSDTRPVVLLLMSAHHGDPLTETTFASGLALANKLWIEATNSAD